MTTAKKHPQKDPSARGQVPAEVLEKVESASPPDVFRILAPDTSEPFEEPDVGVPGGTLVRATITLSGLRVGHLARVDLDDPFVALCVDRQYLIPVAE